MHNTALELYNDLLQIHFDEYYSLLGVKRSKMDSKYDPANLTLDEYDYSEWHKELDDLPPVEGDEEKYYTSWSTQLSKGAKEGKWLKILTANKLLIRFTILYSTNKSWK